MISTQPAIAPELEEACARIAAAARAEVIWTHERDGRIPDAKELALAIAPALEEEILRREVESELAGEMRVARQYSAVLEDLLPAVQRASELGPRP